jgi:ADP-ribose pyrophosphatase YjhB (NUDIX family)/SAM-dependent methyltransferase
MSLSKMPRVGVGIIITKGNQVLLLRRHNVHGAGSWSTPGGHLDFGESPEVCAIREAKEETNVTVTNVRFRAVTNDFFAAEGKHYITLWLEGDYAGGEPRVNAAYEMAEVGWFAWDALPQPLFLSLQQLLDGNHYPPENVLPLVTQVLNEEGRALWDQKATFWDALHGDEGNQFHRRLVAPAVERLLALQPGERVLDVACGNGVMARRLAALGGRVTAVDFSLALIKKARQRGQPAGEPIQYGVADATDEEALAALGEGQFDAVVCTMALMDMPVIAPLYRAVRRLLVENGRFVFANAHPAFNSNNPVFVIEQADDDGQLITTRGVKINAYLAIPPLKGVGAPGEPGPHTYYHRPLHQLLGEAFAAGLVLDALEEPTFAPEDADPQRPLSWSSLWQIPPVLVGRLHAAN